MHKLIHRTDFDGTPNVLVIKANDDGSFMSFILTDDNPNTAAYLAWVAEGNTPELCNPESAPVDEAQPSTDAG